SLRHVVPPSTDLCRPLPAPPDRKKSGCRRKSHIPAYRTSGSDGSTARSPQPVPASTNSTLLQVSPPSSERNTPRSAWSAKAYPVAQTKTRFAFSGCTSSCAICRESASPLWVQLSRPSRLTYTPVPADTLLRTRDSPVPTHTVCGLFGSTRTAPIDWVCSSNTGLNVVPLFFDRHTPPLAAPT